METKKKIRSFVCPKSLVMILHGTIKAIAVQEELQKEICSNLRGVSSAKNRWKCRKLIMKNPPPKKKCIKKLKRMWEGRYQKMPKWKTPEFDEIQKNPCNAGLMPWWLCQAAGVLSELVEVKTELAIKGKVGAHWLGTTDQ